MNENQNPEIETTDDVEGHGFRFKGAVAPEPTEDDVDGHAKVGRVASADDDVEGHGIRVRFAVPQEPSEDDDVEGHAKASRF